MLESTLDDLMIYAGNRILLVEAKREKEMLKDYIPEATSQAIALSEVTGCVFNLFFFDTINYCVFRNRTVRYCLSDGSKWMFLVYTRDDKGGRISYEGPVLSIMQARAVQEEFAKDVGRLIEVLYHWVCPVPKMEL